jgi:hypothetical protein
MLNQHSYRVSRLGLAIILFASALLLIAVSSCSGGRTLVSHGTPRPFIADDAVAQALALQPPSGVDPAVFGKLRDELVRQLRLRAEGKLPATAPQGAGGQVTDLTYDAGTGDLTWTYANAGDYNLDGIVGVADITPIAAHFGDSTSDGSPDDAVEAWIDTNNDGSVGIDDVTPIAMYYASEVALYSINAGASLDGAFTEISSVGFASRDTGTIPPTFSYSDLGLPSAGAYCKVQPVDSQSIVGIFSTPLNITTGSGVITNGVIGPDGGALNGGSVEVEFRLALSPPTRPSPLRPDPMASMMTKRQAASISSASPTPSASRLLSA